VKKNRVIIAGGRDFNNWEFLRENVTYYTFLMPTDEIEIVSGKQMSVDKETGEMYGADFLGERYAKEYSIPIKPFPANWSKYGNAAGLIRNKEMAAYSTHLIAFWDGKSKGTKNMIDEARAAGLKIRVINY
jgi:hypothetical protein